MLWGRRPLVNGSKGRQCQEEGGKSEEKKRKDDEKGQGKKWKKKNRKEIFGVIDGNGRKHRRAKILVVG